MQNELLNQVDTILNTPEKWNVYLEMSKQTDNFKNLYSKELTNRLLNYFNENKVKGWECDRCSILGWGNPNQDLCWYLEDFGKDSLVLRIAWVYYFCLYLSDTNSFDQKKMSDLLKSDYQPLISGFITQPKRSYESNVKVGAGRIYSFNSQYDKIFETDDGQSILTWFAGNRTEEFAQQIIKKVEVFRQSKELTQMLYELNEKSQIKKES